MPVTGYEWIWIVLVVIILIFGARKLPELAKSLGRSSGEFKKGKLEAEKEAAALEAAGGEDREKLEKIARELGIKTEGLTEAELKEKIKKSIAAQ